MKKNKKGERFSVSWMNSAKGGALVMVVEHVKEN